VERGGRARGGGRGRGATLTPNPNNRYYPSHLHLKLLKLRGDGEKKNRFPTGEGGKEGVSMKREEGLYIYIYMRRKGGYVHGCMYNTCVMEEHICTYNI
jgi:hypothetical protein